MIHAHKECAFDNKRYCESDCVAFGITEMRNNNGEEYEICRCKRGNFHIKDTEPRTNP